MDYFALWHFRNRNQTSEIPKISTSQPQTPNKGIGTLSAKCATQEVQKSSSKYKDLEKLTYQYGYIKCRGGHRGDFEESRRTVVFLNNNK